MAVVASYYLTPKPWAAILLRAERARAGVSNGQSVVEGRRIAYLERGGPAEPILFVHTFGGSSDDWVRFVAAFPASHRMIAIDLPAFGNSTALKDDAFDIESQATHAWSIARALGGRKLHLVGASMGGHIVAAMATQAPNAVVSITLIEPHGIKTDAPSTMDARIAHGEAPLVVRSNEAFDRLLSLTFVEKPFVPYPVLDHLRNREIECAKAYDAIWRTLLLERTALGARLEKLRMPMLGIWGDSNGVFHVQGADVARTHAPQIQTVIMRGVGHLPMIEKPAATAAIVASFLQSIEVRDTLD